MGSTKDKKTGLIGEKSHTVHSVNWKLDALLQKELSMLDTSKRRVEHRISMDQAVAKKRFQLKLHRSKLYHARMKGDKEMLKKLITKDNYDFNTNASSEDVLNKRREKDLATKRILHRQSQDQMMMYRGFTPAATPVTLAKESLGSRIVQQEMTKEREDCPVSVSIRPMTAVERISSAQKMAAGTAKLRPVSVAGERTKTFPSVNLMTLPHCGHRQLQSIRTSSSDEMKFFPEKFRAKKARDIIIVITEVENEDVSEQDAQIRHGAEENTSGETLMLCKETHDPQHNDYHKIDNEQMGNNGKPLKNHTACDLIPKTSTPRTSVLRPKTSFLRPKTSVLRPRSSILRPRTAPGVSRQSSSLSSSMIRARPKTSVSISTDVASDQSDDEMSTAKHPNSSRSNKDRRKSQLKSKKSKRKQSAPSIFTDQKTITIMDIDEARRERAKQKSRIDDFVNALDDVKTDPDLIVDYYMAKLLEETSLSGTKKNVERIRDMPDSDYDQDLAKRSIGNLKKDTITFRDVNRNYSEYQPDPRAPLHTRNSGLDMSSRQERRLLLPTKAWDIDNTDSDTG